MIIVRITLTEPKTALAGVMLEASFARFKASMAVFNTETTPSCSLGRWDSVFIVEVEVAGREPCSAEAMRNFSFEP